MRYIYKVITIEVESDAFGDFSSELFSWYPTKKKAMRAIEMNAGDMQDACYTHVLLSKSYPGAYGLHDQELQWYKWEDGHWVPTCVRPTACCNFFITS